MKNPVLKDDQPLGGWNGLCKAVLFGLSNGTSTNHRSIRYVRREAFIPKEQERMALNYVNQPPMIPHSVEGYQITNTNRCLQCHGVENYRTRHQELAQRTYGCNRKLWRRHQTATSAHSATCRNQTRHRLLITHLPHPKFGKRGNYVK